MTLSAGTRLGPYEIVAPLGAGGMGEVFRARDTRLERDVAIKVLPHAASADPAARARLLREARLASRLNHPNVCTIHEVGEAEGKTFIVMEVVEGESLGDRLARGALPCGEILRYGIQVADALSHAHGHGVLHRDLKSANVVVTADGRAKVLDFGLAKQMASPEDAEATTLSRAALPATTEGTLAGTLAYMAPEQLRGQAADARSDLWSLGVVLYEMATAERPFRAAVTTALAADIQYKEPAPPRRTHPNIPPALEDVILKCLKKHPEERYQTAEEVMSDLQAIAANAHASSDVVSGSRKPPVRRSVRRRRIRSLVVLPLANLSGDPEQEYFADGMTDALIGDLAGIGALRVISRTSAMRYKRTEKSLPDIAAELNVDAVLEGSVLRAGARVRITARLIEGATDMNLWAKSYERDLSDVLALQGDVAGAIVREVQSAASTKAAGRLARRGPVNAEAWDACLKGRYHLYKLSREHYDTALGYFEMALEKDPACAPAYAGLADLWLLRGDSGILPPSETFPKAQEAASKAIQLDDGLVEGHLSQAGLKFLYEWDWKGAEAAYERALQLNPNSADARFFYSDFLISMRRSEEAMEQSAIALKLDPFNSFMHCFTGWHLVYLHRYEEAMERLEKVARVEPNFPSAQMGLWGVLHAQSRDGGALLAAKRFFALIGDREVSGAMEQGGTESGYAGAMRRAAEALAARSERTYIPSVRVARLWAHAGETERALAWLEKSFERRESPLVHLGVAWDWEPLRSDRRFQDLLRRMDLLQS
jgi:serine/threonine-protein kinase